MIIWVFIQSRRCFLTVYLEILRFINTRPNSYRPLPIRITAVHHKFNHYRYFRAVFDRRNKQIPYTRLWREIGDTFGEDL